MSGLDVLPLEILRELLLSGDTLSLLRLRRSNPEDRTGRLLYESAFWEAYCTHRNWRVMKARKSHTWETIALVMDLRGKSIETIRESLSNEKETLIPPVCLESLVEIVRFLHKGRQLELLLMMMKTAEDMIGLDTPEKQPVWDIECFSPNTLMLPPKRYNQEDSWVIGVQSMTTGIVRTQRTTRFGVSERTVSTPDPAPSAPDLQASRRALREMYQDDTRRRQQSRTGWHAGRRDHVRRR